MLTAPARPRYASFFRNTWKLRREAQSTVSWFGRKLGSEPVTHCGAAMTCVGPMTATALAEAARNVRRLTLVTADSSPGASLKPHAWRASKTRAIKQPRRDGEATFGVQISRVCAVL